MMSAPKITFIGAGSTIFVKNILGDVFHREALKTAHIALMDIDPTRLEESHIVVRKLMDSAGASGKITCHTQQKEALQDADFVVVAFQIGGYEPCTVTDFEVCKRHGLEQTIADTLGPGGIMRALRTIPHLWQICEDMTEVCPDATMLNYVNPMAMNTWAMYARYPHIKQVGLCHSVQGTAEELARDLNIDPATLRYRCAGVFPGVRHPLRYGRKPGETGADPVGASGGEGDDPLRRSGEQAIRPYRRDRGRDL